MSDSTAAARSIKGPVWVGGDLGRRPSWADGAAETAAGTAAGKDLRHRGRCDRGVSVRLGRDPGDGSADRTTRPVVGNRFRG